MNNLGKVLKVLGIVTVVVAIGIFIGWLGSRSTTPAVSTSSPVRETVANSSMPTAPVNYTSSNLPTKTVRTGPNPVVRSGSVTNWEDRVDNILGSEGEEAAKARELLALFPQLPPEGQVEVAQHLSNLVLDEDYAPLGALLTDASLSEDVLDVLMGDILNRPNSVKLPLLLDVAENGNHPKAAEAKDLLELFLEEDYGNNWNQWRAKAQEWLQANPD